MLMMLIVANALTLGLASLSAYLFVSNHPVAASFMMFLAAVSLVTPTRKEKQS